MKEPEHTLVPALIGLEVGNAHALALTARVALTSPNSDFALPLGGTVSAQRPTAGTQVLPGDPVTIWVRIDPDDGPDDDDGGGGSGGGGGGSVPDPDGPRPRDPAGVK